MLDLTVAEIREQLRKADAKAFKVLERSLVADARKGVRSAVEVARRRLEAESAERERLSRLYSFEAALMRWGVVRWRVRLPSAPSS